MKTLILLAALLFGAGCTDTKPPAETDSKAKPTALTAPIQLGNHVRGQLDIEKQRAQQRRDLLDQGLESDQ